MTTEERILLQLKLQACKTNHIFHLLMTTATLGAWVVVWVIVTIGNISDHNALLVSHGLPAEDFVSRNFGVGLLAITIIGLVVYFVTNVLFL